MRVCWVVELTSLNGSFETWGVVVADYYLANLTKTRDDRSSLLIAGDIWSYKYNNTKIVFRNLLVNYAPPPLLQPKVASSIARHRVRRS